MRRLGFWSICLISLLWPTLTFGLDITVTDLSNDASLTVSAYDSDTDSSITVNTIETGKYSIVIADDFFSQDAYRFIYLTLSWKPAEGSDVVSSVKEMSLELPVLLRAWDKSNIEIRSSYFLGIGEKNVLAYEGQWRAGTQLERLLGSLLLRTHYEENLSDPQNRHVRRVTEAALSAARQVANVRPWFNPPAVLTAFAEKSSKDPSASASLLEEMRAGPLIDLLLAGEEITLDELSCAQWEDFFKEIEALSQSLPVALANRYPEGNFKSILREKKRLTIEKLRCQ